MSNSEPATMQTIRFHSHGEWTDVLRLEEAPIPIPRADQVRVRVHACALNPMDWVLCLGQMPGPVPGGIGLDVSGTVDAVGEGITNVCVGDLVFGVPDLVLHTALAPGVLPDLIKIAGGDARHVMSITDFDEKGLGVRTTGREPDLIPRYDVLSHFAQLAAEGITT